MQRIVVLNPKGGSGKTTLARRLADQIPCPMLSRDELREGLLFGRGGTAAAHDDLVALQANAAFFDAVERLLGHGVSLVIEAAFQHRLWAGPLARLEALADIRIVRCRIDPDLALRRMSDRLGRSARRQTLHPDRHYIEAQSSRSPEHRPFDAVQMDSLTLDVDTTEGYRPDLAAILAIVTQL